MSGSGGGDSSGCGGCLAILIGMFLIAVLLSALPDIVAMAIMVAGICLVAFITASLVVFIFRIFLP